MADKHTQCDCGFCVKGKEIAAVLKRRDPDEMARMIKELASLWLCADFERSYAECILDGSWPTAVEILTASLEKAKIHPNRVV